MKKIYGYARVSTKEQNLDRQLIALKAFGVDDRDIIREKSSGKSLVIEMHTRHCGISCSEKGTPW